MTVPADSRTSAEIEASLGPSLTERTRLCLVMVLTSLAVFLFFDFLYPDQQFEVLSVIHAIRLLVLGACFIALHRSPTHDRALIVAVVTVAAVVLSSSAMSIVRGEYASNALLCVTVAMGTATLLPWGIRAQMLSVAVSASALVTNIYMVTDSVAAVAAPPASVMGGVAFGISVYLASEFDRTRRVMAQRLVEVRTAEERTRDYHKLISAMHQTELQFISYHNPAETFDALLTTLLALTRSESGFIGEILEDEKGTPYVRTHAVTDIAWDEASRRLYDQKAPNLEMPGIGNLLGEVIRTGEAVIANDLATDDRRSKAGHPKLQSFVGLPLRLGDRMVGIVGIADREGGYDEALVKYLQPFVTSCAHLTNAYHNDLLRRQAEEEVRQLNTNLERRVSKRTVDLETANRELALANQELERFSYTVSHDLRSPLRAITGFSQVVLDEHSENLSAQALDYLTRARDGALHMGALIDDLLTLARVSQGRLRNAAVDVSAIARSIVEGLEADSPERNVEFVIGGDLVILGDAKLLRIALSNLLGNAWKFTSKNETAHIEFNVSDGDGHRTYFVRDDGVGFNMNFVDKLFKPFNRLHEPDEFGGTGIGLATVERVISRHQGTVWAESPDDGGATFYFSLDATRAQHGKV